ncbi:unnamed protein product [Arabidopsis halleri]
MDIGGKKDRNNDKDNRKKDKGKEKEIAEEEMPRNKKYMDLPSSWDWRIYLGIISNVLEQGTDLICWAIAFTRAMEALFNIGKRLEHQRSFSIQHFVNNIPLGTHGLEDCRTLGNFVEKHGILEEGECSYKRSKQDCTHVNPTTETIDRFVVIDCGPSPKPTINSVDDVDLARLVMRHPVVGVLPLWNDLNKHRQSKTVGEEVGAKEDLVSFTGNLEEEDVHYFFKSTTERRMDTHRKKRSKRRLI